jgi:hypothetical protein
VLLAFDLLVPTMRGYRVLNLASTLHLPPTKNSTKNRTQPPSFRRCLRQLLALPRRCLRQLLARWQRRKEGVFFTGTPSFLTGKTHVRDTTMRGSALGPVSPRSHLGTTAKRKRSTISYAFSCLHGEFPSVKCTVVVFGEFPSVKCTVVV